MSWPPPYVASGPWYGSPPSPSPDTSPGTTTGVSPPAPPPSPDTSPGTTTGVSPPPPSPSPSPDTSPGTTTGVSPPPPSPSPSPDTSPGTTTGVSPPAPPPSPDTSPGTTTGVSSTAPPPAGTTTLALAPSPTPRPPQTLNGIIIGVVLGSLGLLIIGGICVFVYWKRRRHGLEEGNHLGAPPQPKADEVGGVPQHGQSTVTPPSPSPRDGKGELPLLNQRQSSASLPTPPPVHASITSISLALSQSTFTYDELALATDGFSDSNFLGQGGFGYVHKGVLPNGKTVAVKQLKAESIQAEREFHAEVEVISRVHHRHLVSLVGFCISGGQRMLVYEFVPNGTLEFHLHGKDRPTMDWSTRMKIAIGSAKGLGYLHEDCHPKIIHRDIKASNILLDNNFEAKVADFGLAKFSLDTDTHVSTRIMGTFGYFAPEYASSGKLTDKSDVFSFGVVLLELITGQKPVNKTESSTDDNLVEWAGPLLSQALKNGNFGGLADPRLQTKYNLDEMRRMTTCAATCVNKTARHRPRMSQVVRALEGNNSLDDLSKGSTPGQSRGYGSIQSSSYDTGQYNEDMEKYRKLALKGQEQGTSGYSGPSSESGQHPSTSTSSGQQNTQEMEMGM